MVQLWRAAHHSVGSIGRSALSTAPILHPAQSPQGQEPTRKEADPAGNSGLDVIERYVNGRTNSEIIVVEPCGY